MLSMALVVAVALVGAEEASPQEQLEAWAEDFVGTWVGDESTLDTDVAGLGKKGDKIVVQGTIEPANGVYQITWETQVNGKLTTSGMAVVGWDASAKKVRARYFNKHGGTGSITYTKRGKKWVSRGVSLEADGTKSSDKAVMTVSDKSHTYKVSDRKHGEESLPDKEQVWTRK
jgi:hypothetical protein